MSRDRGYTEDSQVDEFADIDMSSLLEGADLTPLASSSRLSSHQVRGDHGMDEGVPPPPPLETTFESYGALSPPTPPRYDLLRQEVRTLKQQRLAGISDEGNTYLFGQPPPRPGEAPTPSKVSLSRSTTDPLTPSVSLKSQTSAPNSTASTLLGSASSVRAESPSSAATKQQGAKLEAPPAFSPALAAEDEAKESVRDDSMIGSGAIPEPAALPSATYSMGFGRHCVVFSKFDRLYGVVKGAFKSMKIALRPVGPNAEWDASIFDSNGQYCHFHVNIWRIGGDGSEEHTVHFSFIGGDKFTMYGVLRRVTEALQVSGCPVYIYAGLEGHLRMKGSPRITRPSSEELASPSLGAEAASSLGCLGLSPPPPLPLSAPSIAPRVDVELASSMMMSDQAHIRLEGAKMIASWSSRDAIRQQLLEGPALLSQLAETVARDDEKGYTRAFALRALSRLVTVKSLPQVTQELWQLLVDLTTSNPASGRYQNEGWAALESRRQSARAMVEICRAVLASTNGTSDWLEANLASDGGRSTLIAFRRAAALCVDHQLSVDLAELLKQWHSIVWRRGGGAAGGKKRQPAAFPMDHPRPLCGSTFCTAQGSYDAVLSAVHDFLRRVSALELSGGAVDVSFCPRKAHWSIDILTVAETCLFDVYIQACAPAKYEIHFSLLKGDKGLFNTLYARALGAMRASSGLAIATPESCEGETPRRAGSTRRASSFPQLFSSSSSRQDKASTLSGLDDILTTTGVPSTVGGTSAWPTWPATTDGVITAETIHNMLSSQSARVRLEGARLASNFSALEHTRKRLCGSPTSLEKFVHKLAELTFGRGSSSDDVDGRARSFSVLALSNLSQQADCRDHLSRISLESTDEARSCALAVARSLGMAQALSRIFGVVCVPLISQFAEMGWA